MISFPQSYSTPPNIKYSKLHSGNCCALAVNQASCSYGNQENIKHFPLLIPVALVFACSVFATVGKPQNDYAFDGAVKDVVCSSLCLSVKAHCTSFMLFILHTVMKCRCNLCIPVGRWPQFWLMFPFFESMVSLVRMSSGLNWRVFVDVDFNVWFWPHRGLSSYILETSITSPYTTLKSLNHTTTVT